MTIVICHTAFSSDHCLISFVKLGSWFMVNEIISVTNTDFFLQVRLFYPSASHPHMEIIDDYYVDEIVSSCGYPKER
jgi:hypothetical protein